jgi:hypothetical protein
VSTRTSTMSSQPRLMIREFKRKRSALNGHHPRPIIISRKPASLHILRSSHVYQKPIISPLAT